MWDNIEVTQAKIAFQPRRRYLEYVTTNCNYLYYAYRTNCMFLNIPAEQRGIYASNEIKNMRRCVDRQFLTLDPQKIHSFLKIYGKTG
jgi:hypothetical protein